MNKKQRLYGDRLSTTVSIILSILSDILTVSSRKDISRPELMFDRFLKALSKAYLEPGCKSTMELFYGNS